MLNESRTIIDAPSGDLPQQVPFEIDGSERAACGIRRCAFRSRSPVIENVLSRVTNDWNVELGCL
jgi:hypothetical protein